MTATDTRARILDYIARELVGGERGSELTADTELLGGELIDSLGVMNLVAFLENGWRIAIPAAGITIGNFMTVERIAAYVESLEADDERRPVS